MIPRTIVAEFPAPAQHTNYRGNCTGSVGRVLGPMWQSEGVPAGQYLTVVDETYDADKDTTRLGLAYGALDLVDPATVSSVVELDDEEADRG